LIEPSIIKTATPTSRVVEPLDFGAAPAPKKKNPAPAKKNALKLPKKNDQIFNIHLKNIKKV